ncbi:C1 family peptidase [Psychroserpens sp.]
MKQIYLSILVTILLFTLQGCISNKRFSKSIIVPSTELKHQKYTGQCWSFASTSLLEAESIRLGYSVPELSSFFFVYYNYLDNAKDYLINKGESRLNRGDLTFSVLEVFENYGAVPESVYNGNLSGILSKKQMLVRWKEEDEMNALIRSKLDSLIKTDLNIDSSLKIVEEILSDYIGKPPKTFKYKQETLTSKEFTSKYLPLNAKDYLELTSYSNHTFYKKIVLEIPANWRHKTYLNLPIEDFIYTIDNAINNGFTLAWDGDIGSKEGFKDNGYVKVKGEYENIKTISQEQRQSAYKRKTTTDDHNMHLVGITYDRNGQKFYILKNTWGENRGMDGIWYLSENYFRLRTISITVHKDGILNEIKEKLVNKNDR